MSGFTHHTRFKRKDPQSCSSRSPTSRGVVFSDTYDGGGYFAVLVATIGVIAACSSCATIKEACMEEPDLVARFHGDVTRCSSSLRGELNDGGSGSRWIEFNQKLYFISY